MRRLMGVIKDRFGTYHARKKVPEGLAEAVARVLGRDKARQSWLQKSLDTKDTREANLRAKPVLMEFDRILAKAAALVEALPRRDELAASEVKRIADWFYASCLTSDEDARRSGLGSDEVYLAVAADLEAQGIVHEADHSRVEAVPWGLSDREWTKRQEAREWVLPAAREALARGDLRLITEEIEDAAAVFGFSLDPSSETYRRLGYALLQAYVRSPEVQAARDRGEVIETPAAVVEPKGVAQGDSGATLGEVFEGWCKAENPRPNTVREFGYAIRRFTELHGAIPIRQLNKTHARQFREALQKIPKRRSGQLLNASLPELTSWSQDHPEAECLGNGTVNKLLTGVQATLRWGHRNGYLPEDQPWADPFGSMRLKKEASLRLPYEAADLSAMFSWPVFARGERPRGGGGEAAFWLPLLGLFTGARVTELAQLSADNVLADEGVTYRAIVADLARGKHLKSASAHRAIPLHPELLRLGFPAYVANRRRQNGTEAWLFPELEVGLQGKRSEAWVKWWGRYARQQGLTDPRKTFHSFRHAFKDALRRGGVGEDVNDALTGHASGSVGRGYGHHEMLRRFTAPVLAAAVAKVSYPGLDLGHLERVGSEAEKSR